MFKINKEFLKSIAGELILIVLICIVFGIGLGLALVLVGLK